MGKCANIWNFHRRKLNVNGKSGCNAPFDDFPYDLKDAYAKIRNTLTSLDPKDDEKGND